MGDAVPSRSIGKVCVFCGSSAGTRPEYRRAAEELGAALAGLGITLVYGGSKIGLMGVLADTVMGAGGQVIGVMPRSLVDREIAHRNLTRLHVVRSMHERKALMIDLADAFVLLPGGFGSWDEFCEAITWSQLGLHAKPCGILNVLDYYGPLLALAGRAVSDGFVRPVNWECVAVETQAEALLGRLEALSATK
jgi:uncharacterized protein (TIGR00730 family)